MNSKAEFIEAFKRILWLEKQMKGSYSQYKKIISDKPLLVAIKAIEDDEARHINMAEQLIALV